MSLKSRIPIMIPIKGRGVDESWVWVRKADSERIYWLQQCLGSYPFRSLHERASLYLTENQGDLWNNGPSLT